MKINFNSFFSKSWPKVAMNFLALTCLATNSWPGTTLLLWSFQLRRNQHDTSEFWKAMISRQLPYSQIMDNSIEPNTDFWLEFLVQSTHAILHLVSWNSHLHTLSFVHFLQRNSGCQIKWSALVVSSFYENDMILY